MQALSSKECIEQSLAKMLIDFRQWLFADTKHLLDWKRRPLDQAIAICPGRMVDAVEDMLAKWRQYSSKDSGSTASLPVMLITIALISAPPDDSELRGNPYWMDVVLPSDPEQRTLQMRTIPQQYRVQVVFISPDAHSPSSLTNQFCAYMSDQFKRRFPVTYHYGQGFSDQFDMTVLNAIYPDTVPTESKIQSIATVDFNVLGLVPQILGLGDTDTDSNGRTPDDVLGAVVVQADLDKEGMPKIIRVDADIDTGDITVSEIDRP